MTHATLALEDGTILEGEGFGAVTETIFELVFNTSMTGYQEILTDPSYQGQGVLFTVSHIGNVGINLEDYESSIPHASAALVRELSPIVSNWRSTLNLSDWLAQYGVPGISKIDTRFLTRKLRDHGTMKAALSTCGTPGDQLVEMARNWSGLDGRDMVQEVTPPAAAAWQGDAAEKWVENRAEPLSPPIHVAVFDFGAKRNIIRCLASFGIQVTVVPAYASCKEVLALHPDGILLSNGPGDPAGLPGIVSTARELIQQDLPIFGICLGHQIIGRAVGGETIRLKFGHHSGNHPVQDLRSGKVQITSQNHNYAVAAASLDPDEVEITHLSLNDHTLEGMRLKNHPVFSVQYHPEASPGPHDAFGLFNDFYQVLLHTRSSFIVIG
jgi:carbamoyl-phosphate synthase small subunit